MKYIDLNADLGEGCENDSEILKYVSSANIACGLHAGSPRIMTDTVRLSIENGVSIGAHPGYPDRSGFGRQNMDLEFYELKAILIYQIGALDAIVRSEGARMIHVKAHGALYNSATKDPDIARAVVQATKEINPELIIFGPAGSFIEIETKKENMEFCAEVFADRAYMSDGSLVPRSHRGAIIEDRELCAERTLTMINDGYVVSQNGDRVIIAAETVCLHGDNDSALEFANHLYNRLKDSGIMIGSKRLES